MKKRRSRFAPVVATSANACPKDVASAKEGKIPGNGEVPMAISPSKEAGKESTQASSSRTQSNSFRIAPAKRRRGASARRKLGGGAVKPGMFAADTGLAKSDLAESSGSDGPLGRDGGFPPPGTDLLPQGTLGTEPEGNGQLLGVREHIAKRPRLNGDSDKFPPFSDTVATHEKRGSSSGVLSCTGHPSLANTAEDSQPDPLDAYMQEVAKSSKTKSGAGLGLGGIVDALNDADADIRSADDMQKEKKGFLDRLRRKRPVYDRIDHALVEYRPFQKDLYREVNELSSMTQDEVRQVRRRLGNVRIRGKKCPAPISSFGQCGLSSTVLEVIRQSGYMEPTPIQAQAIPCVMSGRDVIGVAKTGSGKTLAFLLPVLRHVAMQERPVGNEGPVAMLVAPTRELAIQIHGEARRFGKALNLRCICAYGGSGLKDQITDLKRGADIVVCTPGRMIDLLAMNSGRVTNLQRVTIVVLDEADRMFDMGFEPQLTRLVENVRPDRQTVMFSATFPPQVEKLARKILTKPVEIMVGGNSVPSSSINQHVEVRSEESKFFRLLQLLGEWYDKGSTLVFVDRQDNADRIFRELCQAGYLCLSLHGGMDQADRDSAVADFKNGDVKVLIATSVAARGLDVKHLSLVVNFDVPNHYEDYVHRVGRTGRAGRSGTSYTFLTSDQGMFASDMVKALELSAKSAVYRHGMAKDQAEKRAAEAAKAAVPESLRELAAAHSAKQDENRKAGLVVRTGNSGYGGRGFTFEENEETVQSSLRKSQQRRFKEETGTGDGEDGDSDDPDSAEKEALAKIKVVRRSGRNAGSASSHGKVGPAGVAEMDTDGKLQALVNAAEENARAIAREQGLGEAALAARVVLARTNVLASYHPKASVDPVAAVVEQDREPRDARRAGAELSAATAAAAALNARISGSGTDPVTRSGGSNGAIGKDGPNVEDDVFEAELEINDYPQHARWRVTHANALDDVTENTGCVATTRGNFYPAGRNPPAGERKLHLLVEGPSELAVRSAFTEIKLRLEEAATDRPDDRGTSYSKYSVI